MPSTRVSFLLATCNRRDVLLSTLQHLREAATEADESEIIVVDNASRDQTCQAVRSHFPEVRLIPLANNLGSCAKAVGIGLAGGEYVVFLDDDSHPHPGSIRRMVERFSTDPQLGCAGFTVHLPDGRLESSALPNVFVGCGAGFRHAALREVGGLDQTLFMQAEEYDLSFRLAAAGWRIETFPDLHVDHLKTPQARIARRTLYYDTRNNLLVAARYLPDEHEAHIRRDWSQRYRWIAADAGHPSAYWRGRVESACRHCRERRGYARWRLPPAAFEYLFRFDYIARRMAAIAESGARTIVLAELGKNIRPFVRAARSARLHISSIADDRFATPGRRYEGIPIRPLQEALRAAPDLIVISNTSPAHARRAAERVRQSTPIPVLRWFGCDLPADPTGTDPSPSPRPRLLATSSPVGSCQP
ncbi:MAG: glycosyltransferase family 2 protein [Phycisphaerae bacterium]